MENTPQNNSPRLKRTAAIIVGLLLIGAIATGVILLLRNITSKIDNKPSSQAAVTPGSEVIKAVRGPGTIKSLEKYTQQTNAADTARVVYKSDTHTYTVSVPAKESVLFVAPTLDPQANVAATEEELERFIISQGYEKTDNTGIAATSPPKYFTFKSSIGACQVMSSQPAEAQQTPAFYQVACVDGTAISGEYSSLEMLLSLYKEQGGMPIFTSATQARTSEDNKSLSIVTLNGNGTKTSLLFAAIDNNWEFIGNVGGNQAVSNGKYSISDEIRSKIDDARWGNFLKKSLQITQT